MRYNGLINKPKGRRPKDSNMKVTKNISSENAYIKAENEGIKKRLPWGKQKKLHISRWKSSDYRNTPKVRISTKISSKSYGNSKIYLLFWDF